MSESESRLKARTDAVRLRPVWRLVTPGTTVFVDRCAFCGAFKKQLYMHWFFRGLYCQSCVLDVLYDNCRTVDEIERKERVCVVHGTTRKIG